MFIVEYGAFHNKQIWQLIFSYLKHVCISKMYLKKKMKRKVFSPIDLFLGKTRNQRTSDNALKPRVDTNTTIDRHGL